MSLLAPLQMVFRWMDDHPAMRLLLAIGLLAAAILMPLPAGVLDVWVAWTILSALGVAVLFLAAGQDLAPAEALASIPAFLQRHGLHHMALAAALTRAILLEQSPGRIVEWIAHHGFNRHVGVGVAAIALLYGARLGLAHFHESSRLKLLGEAGRATPEAQLLLEAAQTFRLIGRQAMLGLGLALALLGAGLLTGIVLKGWPLQAVLLHFTVYGLAEGFVTAVPALLLAFAVAQWLRSAPEAEASEEAEPAATEPAALTLEVGRELHGPLKRSFPATVAVVRTRLAAEFGVPSPRLALVANAGLPPGAYRLLLRGSLLQHGDWSEESPEAIASDLERVIASHAGACLSMETSRALLDEWARRHPVLVAQAVDRLGLPAIHGTLRGLLREQVPVTDLAAILEALVVYGAPGAPVAQLIEEARRAIAPALCARLVDESGAISAFELDPAWHEALAAMTARESLDRQAGVELARAVAEARLRGRGRRVQVLVAPRRYRLLIAELLAGSAQLVVLSPDELTPQTPLRLVGVIRRAASAPVP